MFVFVIVNPSVCLDLRQIALAEMACVVRVLAFCYSCYEANVLFSFSSVVACIFVAVIRRGITCKGKGKGKRGFV